MKRLLLSPYRLLKERYFGEETRNPRVAINALAKLSERLPAAVAPIVAEAVHALIDYQDPDYALLYLDRLSRYTGPGGPAPDVFANLAQLLSARMRFEDPISIARLKLDEAGGMTAAPDPTSTERLERFRWDEIIAMLPPAAAGPALDVFAKLRLAKLARRTIKMRFRPTSKFTLLRLKGMAALRISRPFSQRFKTERSWVERWLHMIDRSLVKQPESTAEIVRTADLITGHGDTYQDGLAKWNVIVDDLIKPTCDGVLPRMQLADAVKEALEAALDGVGDARVRQVVDGRRLQCLSQT